MTSYQWLMIVPLLGLLMAAAVVDWRHRLIPNWITFPLLAAGLIASWTGSGIVSPAQAAVGLFVGFSIPFVLFAIGAMGPGDVKLLAGVGAWLGPVASIKVYLAGCIVGLVIVLVQSAWQGRLTTLFRNSAVLTVNLVNFDVVGAKQLTETGQSCRSVDRPLPYAVPILVAVLIIASCG